MAYRYDVAALGSAIVDVLAPVDDKFLLDHNITWPTLLNGTGQTDYARAYGVTDIPASVVVARDGTVAHVDLVHDHLDDAIAKELER